MALTPSTMVSLGTPMPEFSLDGPIGSASSKKLLGKPVVIAFICNHCPYVKHIAGKLPRIVEELAEDGVHFVAISSNDISTHPADSPELMVKEAQLHGYQFPYLYDATQKVARAFKAACTPDFFLYDGSGKLAYRGQLDDSRPGNGQPVTGQDLLSAAQALPQQLSNQKPSLGCNIKWKSH